MRGSYAETHSDWWSVLKRHLDYGPYNVQNFCDYDRRNMKITGGKKLEPENKMLKIVK